MAGSKSKDKGKSFEREVCNYLSDVYSESFQRVFDSGAFTGGSNSVRRQSLSEGQIRNHKGDIVPPDGWKHFNCECKSYAQFPFHQLFGDARVLLLESWIKQTLEASDPGDCNFIIMKFTRKGRYILVDKEENFVYTKYIEYTDESGHTWAFMELDHFFRTNRIRFRNRCKKVKNVN